MLRERNALDAGRLGNVGQLDTSCRVGAAHGAFGVVAARYGIELLEQALAHHGDAEVAGAEILLGAVGDSALPDPGDDILVDDVARNPAAVDVLDRAHPGRNLVLQVGLAPFRHADEKPTDAERVLIVDRHSPFEMVPEIEAIRP